MSEPSQEQEHPETRAHSGRRRRRRPETRWSFVIAIAAVAGVAGAFSGAEPTGILVFDVIERAAFAVAVTLFAACSRRWTWLVLGGVATVFADTIWGHVLGAVALGFAVDAALRSNHRERLTGALIGALGAQVLLRTADIGFFGLTAIIAAVTAATLIVSGYRTMRRRNRTRLLTGCAIVAAFVVIATAGFVFSALRASSPLESGITAARRGLDVANKADQVGAAGYWNSAHNAFAEADRFLSNPIAKIVYPLPVLSQHARLAAVAASSGSEITRTAAMAATIAPYQRIRAADGTFDLDRIAGMEAPVEQTADAMVDARARVDDTTSSWLVGPFRDRVDDYRSQLTRAIPQARDALEAIQVAPELLGGHGKRHYLILFGNPAESRNLGGFIGAWAQLDAEDGHLDLVRHGKMPELNEATDPATRKITGEPEFMRRYGYLQPARYLQNMSASPDFPTVARVAEQLYPQAGGVDIDGVMYVDPRALAALLELTGPVTAEGIPMPLTSENAAKFLMHEQYTDVEDVDERSDLLSNAAEATFNALTERELPAISAITSTLSPMMHQLRIMAVADDPAANAYFTKIGLTGAFPQHTVADFVSVRVANASENKVDFYGGQFDRYTVEHNRTTGRTTATLDSLLANTAPATGPDYVLGNPDTRSGRTDGRPYASLTLQLSIYSTLRPTRIQVAGRTVGLQVERELGHWVTTRAVTIPRAESRRVKVEFEGEFTPDRPYRIDTSQQPTPGRSAIGVTYLRTDEHGKLVAVPKQTYLQRNSGRGSFTPRPQD